MDRSRVPTAYTQRLTDYLSGGTLDPLLDLFAEGATVERYIWGEPPRVYCGIEQIEESLLRLPPVGGSFHIRDVRIEPDAVHARFFTQGFPYPLSGMYRFELNEVGQIARLYISARYSTAHAKKK
jgi:hypothetical protein